MRNIDNVVADALRPKIPSAQPLRKIRGFGDWLESGVAAPVDTRRRVEGELSSYLAASERIGRDWGTAAGRLLGAGALVLIVLIRVIVKVLV